MRSYQVLCAVYKKLQRSGAEIPCKGKRLWRDKKVIERRTVFKKEKYKQQRGDLQKDMQNRQIDKKSTKQVRIDAGLHQLLKVKAAESSITIKGLLEEYLMELLAIDEKIK